MLQSSQSRCDGFDGTTMCGDVILSVATEDCALYVQNSLHAADGVPAF